MDAVEPDDGHDRPAVLRRRDRFRAFVSSASRNNSEQSRPTRLQGQLPSLLRRLTSRRSSNATPRSLYAPSEGSDTPTVVPRRGATFSSRARSPTPQFSYIHRQTVTTISDRRDQELEDVDTLRPFEQEEDMEEDYLAGRSRRRRFSLQMSNFFTNVTSPRNRAGMLFPSYFCDMRPFSPTSAADSNHSRPRNRVQEPLAELGSFDLRPPTPAEVRVSTSQEGLEGVIHESEYERGYTPRRRRPRPQPFVPEPHDGDYIRRRRESRQTRRATWGPTGAFSVRNNDSSESFNAYAQRHIGRLSPSPSINASTPPHTSTSRSSIFSRAFSNNTSLTPPEAAEATRPATPVPSPERHSFFRPGLSLGLRNRMNAPSRRQSRRLENWADAATPEGRIPLAELQRLLTSYAAQTGSDRDPDGHQETTVDGGTITIYGIRRVSPRTDSDTDDDTLFPLMLPPMAQMETQPEGQQNESRFRGRRRRPRRIFNFYGDTESMPRNIEETFDRLRRTRRPRSMFGSGSLRRNGVVEPDVPGPSEGSTFSNEDSSSSSDSDETWIFYIVSAVLPEGHPLLSAPSLFTENPTYEDMLFLDSFLHKPVATRTELATAPGLYRIHKRVGGELYASGKEMDGADIEVGTERCLICLSDFEEGDDARVLVKCDHLFHKECIDTWLTEGRNSCPLCRGEGVEKKQTTRSSRLSASASSSALASSSRSNVL